jgi:quercetin 2,3-dioxygenase
MDMPRERRIDRVVTAPSFAPGFARPGHLTARIVSPAGFAANDPFIAVMDDRLPAGDSALGRSHAHAGHEAITLVVDGALDDRDAGIVLESGEVQWMTAGRGIVHGEDVAARGRVRLLRLWLTLPAKERWAAPAVQTVRADAIPVRRENGVDVRVYSGASGRLRSTTRNHVPITLVELAMAAHAVVDQEFPASYAGFAYVLRGSVSIGRNGALLEMGQLGWLDRADSEDTHTLRVRAGKEGARLVLCAGEPQRAPIVTRGPFVAGSEADLARLLADYRAGRFQRLSDIEPAKTT